jgi:hypothetical protein
MQRINVDPLVLQILPGLATHWSKEENSTTPSANDGKHDEIGFPGVFLDKPTATKIPPILPSAHSCALIAFPQNCRWPGPLHQVANLQAMAAPQWGSLSREKGEGWSLPLNPWIPIETNCGCFGATMRLHMWWVRFELKKHTMWCPTGPVPNWFLKPMKYRHCHKS